ncbi:MAG TPA: FHA domain-containing protein [Candidatus Binataceae bacterium]|nr:FHA domain-containing protein [Candidatus Binataceae bacterium]
MRSPAVGLVVAALALPLLLLARPSVARADLQIAIGNPGLSHFDSDGGVELDFGMTDQNGAPVGNLTKDDVQVFEDGQPAQILYFRGVGQGRPVDIVFVLDVTESMQPYIDGVKQSIISFAHDLAANNRDFRLGLVTFEDYVVSQYPDCNCEYRNQLTPDVNKFIGWVGALHAGGGGDIPEDQLDGLAYAATLPFRPDAQAIVVLVTDAPPHVAGDGPDREGDEAYQLHHPDKDADVTEETGPKVADLYQKQGLTLYAVAPPPFIAPQYEEIVQATHGRLYNIVTDGGSRFPELVREIGHSIATEYSLTYRTPRPIEDGTRRNVELRVTYNGQSASADTSYQVKGIGGAAINVPSAGGASGETSLPQLAFAWWNAAVPLIALMALFALSRVRFGVGADELKAIVEAQNAAPVPSFGAAVREVAQRARAAHAPPARPAPPLVPATTNDRPGEARLEALDRLESIPTEYALMKPEIAVGRGENNDIVIPHASVSRNHARLVRRDGFFELTDLNSTNGSYVNDQLVQGSVRVASGSEVRFGDIRFLLRC